MTEGVRDKVVVSSGLGEAAARKLAKEGAKLVLGARRMFAMSHPEDVDINEILFRPTSQEL